MDTMQQEVELLFPQGQEVTVAGEKLKIMPFTFGQFPKVLACLKGVRDEIEEQDKDGKMVKRTMAVDEILIQNGDKLLDLCALATGKPISFFEKVSLVEGVDLVQAMVQVNGDFFVKRLQPKLLKAMGELNGLLGGASSLASSKPVTT